MFVGRCGHRERGGLANLVAKLKYEGGSVSNNRVTSLWSLVSKTAAKYRVVLTLENGGGEGGRAVILSSRTVGDAKALSPSVP